MNITEIAECVWDNSKTIDFGNSPTWCDNLFTGKWCKEWKGDGAGWYWFLVEMTYDELHNVTRPSTLPKKGCDIGARYHINTETFASLLCQHKDNFVVIYNGHEENVTVRIRAHFALNNDKTGAIGIKHYSLSDKKWAVKYFSKSCFPNNIDSNKKQQIELLMNDKSGRCAVESAWRVKYGWPILCKE